MSNLKEAARKALEAMSEIIDADEIGDITLNNEEAKEALDNLIEAYDALNNALGLRQTA